MEFLTNLMSLFVMYLIGAGCLSAYKNMLSSTVEEIYECLYRIKKVHYSVSISYEKFKIIVFCILVIIEILFGVIAVLFIFKNI